MTSIYPASSVDNNENGPFHSISSKMQSNSSASETNSKAPTSGRPARMDSATNQSMYLNRLILFKSIFGITFCGKHFHNYPNAHFRPLLIAALVLYDLLCMAVMLLLEFHAFNEYIYSRLFRHASSRLTMSIIFRSAGYCIIIEYLSIKLLTLTRGPPLIQSITEIGRGVRFNSSCLTRYYMIYVVIVLEIVIHSASFVLMFKPMIELDTLPLTRGFMIAYYAIAGIIYGANKSCICSMHMYASILICKRISENKENLQSCPNFGVMLEDMLQLKNQLSDFNDFLSLTLLVKVVINSILLCTCVCAIDQLARTSPLNIESLVALSLLFVSQLMDEVVSCLASQTIANGMESLIRAIQELTAQQCTEYLHLSSNPRASSSLSEENNNVLSQCRSVDDIEYRCLQHICSMKGSFLYSIFYLFDLQSVTILAILGNVCNYSVLLIQTTDLDT